MELSNVDILLLVTLLDSIATGLVLPLLGLHITNLGGYQLTVGCLISFTFLAHALSRDFLVNFEHGKKMGIVMSSTFSFFIFVILTFNFYYHIVLLCGILHAMSNRVCDYCKEYVMQTKNDGRKSNLGALFDLMNVIGLVVGPIGAGYIYSLKNNVVHNALTAALISYLNCLLLMLVDNDPPDPGKIPEKAESISRAKLQVKSVMQVDYVANWHRMILKIAYVASFTIFFTEFALLLTYNFGMDPVTIGYTVAYQNLLLFLCNCAGPYVRRAVAMDTHAQQIFEYTLMLCSLLLLWMYFTPTFRVYLLSVIPLFLTHAVVDSIWEPLDVDVDGEMVDANKALTNAVGVAVPITFGYYCDVKGVAAFKFFAVLPPVFCIYYVKQNFFNASVRTLVEKISEKGMRYKEMWELKKLEDAEEEKRKQSKKRRRKRRRSEEYSSSSSSSVKEDSDEYLDAEKVKKKKKHRSERSKSRSKPKSESFTVEVQQEEEIQETAKKSEEVPEEPKEVKAKEEEVKSEEITKEPEEVKTEEEEVKSEETPKEPEEVKTPPIVEEEVKIPEPEIEEPKKEEIEENVPEETPQEVQEPPAEEVAPETSPPEEETPAEEEPEG